MVSEIKGDIVQKSQYFYTPPAFSAPIRGSPSIYCRGKIRMVDLRSGEKGCCVDTIPVCDGRTDGHVLHCPRCTYLSHDHYVV